MSLPKRFWIVKSLSSVLVCPIALVVLLGCELERPLIPKASGDVSSSLLEVSVVRVNPSQKVRERKVVLGKLIPSNPRAIGFERGGRVETLRKSQGDSVTEGELIAALEQPDELLSRQRQFQEALQRAKSSLTTATAVTAPEIQRRISQIEGQLKGIDAALEQGLIIASYPGLITKIDIKAGQDVSPSKPVVVIVEDAVPLLEVRATKLVASDLQVAQEVWAGMGNQSSLVKVLSQSPIRRPVAGQAIVFQFAEQPKNDLWSYGDVVELRFFSDKTQEGSWVPLSALQSSMDGWSVLIVKEQDENAEAFSIERRSVSVLAFQDNQALIDDSIYSGELIVSQGTHRVVIGQRVLPKLVATNSQNIQSQGAAN